MGGWRTVGPWTQEIGVRRVGFEGWSARRVGTLDTCKHPVDTCTHTEDTVTHLNILANTVTHLHATCAHKHAPAHMHTPARTCTHRHAPARTCKHAWRTIGRMLDFGQFDFGQFDFGQLAEVEIGRSRSRSFNPSSPF